MVPFKLGSKTTKTLKKGLAEVNYQKLLKVLMKTCQSDCCTDIGGSEQNRLLLPARDGIRWAKGQGKNNILLYNISPLLVLFSKCCVIVRKINNTLLWRCWFCVIANISDHRLWKGNSHGVPTWAGPAKEVVVGIWGCKPGPGLRPQQQNFSPIKVKGWGPWNYSQWGPEKGQG